MTAYAQTFASTPSFHAEGSRWTLATALKLVRQWIEVSRQRCQLAEMTNDQLADIGITRSAAVTEASRPFHQLPASRFPQR